MTANKAILEEAKKYIQHGWTQGSYVRKKYIGRIPIMTALAQRDRSDLCFCALGAISAARGGFSVQFPEVELLQSLIKKSDIPDCALRKAQVAFKEMNPEVRIAMFNDTHTKEEVLELFDKAIATLENT